MSAVLSFPTAVYSVEAVKRAAYRFTDRLSFEISLNGEEIRCSVTALADMTSEDLASVTARVRNEVLDQDLRERIAAETAVVRNVVLAYAFSAAGLQDL
ncbi:MAG TPA: His-Xaa-Ser system protein HxsD [Candidatus Baltobacteraceae bacterium]|nr:His-Xaa-Ser system protein HxsD [Candidatus Baltobacteraceae bacterium]